MSEGRRPNKAIRLATNAQQMIDECVDNPDSLGVWPMPIKRALDVCTSKQRHLAICLASGMADIPAYRMAYKVREDREDRTMHGEAFVCANHPNVLNARLLLEEWLDTKWLMDAGQAIDYGLSLAYEIATTGKDEKTRLRAAETILRVNGAFVSRSEVRHIHESDPSGTIELLDAIKDVIGLAVPKPLPQIEQARVESVELIDAESTPTNL